MDFVQGTTLKVYYDKNDIKAVAAILRLDFRENREKRNSYDWRTQIHHRWCVRLAGTISMGKREV